MNKSQTLLFALMMMMASLAGCTGQSNQDDMDEDSVSIADDPCPNYDPEFPDCDWYWDDDGDLVMNDVDLCSDTDVGALVDDRGCEITDADADGVSDDADQCTNTPANATVDSTGCEVIADADGDGVADSDDQCSNTPANSTVDSTGCEVIADADGDGVADSDDQCTNTPANAIVDTNGCASQTADSDGDGMPDSWEIQHNLDPNDPSDADGVSDDWVLLNDIDNDGLNNLHEYLNSTDPNDSDTDNDGMPDGYEIARRDDAAGITGSISIIENCSCYNPLVNDSQLDIDNDNLSALDEFELASNPFTNDTDGDGLPDSWEAMFGSEGLESTYWPVYGSNWFNSSTDWNNTTIHHILDPNSIVEDPDNDGFPNNCEYKFGTDPLINNSFPGQGQLFDCPDTDGDGWNDYLEMILSSDPLIGSIMPPDSDGDGVTDAWDSFPNDNTEWHDNDNDSIGDNLDTDDDNDGVVDTLDMFPNATGFWIDIDGDGTPHNGNDPHDWLNSSGIGAMILNYVMVGFVDGHESYWISDSPDCPCYAYYYTSTPDIIWTDGHGSSIESVSNLPNVERVLSAMGMGIENLSTTTETMNLGTDTEGVEWTYDNDTRIEWRNYSSTTSTMYLDDFPIFHVNTSLEMYLDYTNLMLSMGQNPVELWGESSVSPIYQFGEESYNLMTKTLYQAFVYDLGENGLNYSFESQNSIIQNTYTWDANGPANKTTLLESILQQTDPPMHAGLYDSITTNLTEQQPEEENQTLMTSSRSYSNEGTTYRDD